MKDTSQPRVREGTMIKVMSSPCGVRTQHVSGWVSIIWLTLAISVPVTADVPLHTTAEVAARCGENVTLTCGTALLQDITYFAWVAKNKTYSEGQSDAEVQCKRTGMNSNPMLSLTLINVMPGDKGKYLCKLRSTQGTNSSATLVTVQDCLESYNSSINKSQAKCSFSGVYPRGIIHWSQGDVNLTGLGSTQEEEDQEGRYSVSSTIYVQGGNHNQSYKCQLWIPSHGKYLFSHELHLTDRLIDSVMSSGGMVRLQWIFLMVEILMVKFMI